MYGIFALLACSDGPAAPVSVALDADTIHALREWPTIAVAPARVEPARAPAVPTLPPVEAPTDGDLRVKLRILVRALPLDSTRDAMLAAIESKSLGVELKTKPGQAGAFAVAVFPTEDRPFLGLDRAWLAGVSDEAGILQAWLLLAHEFRHYQQWLVADEAHRLTFAVYPDRPPDPLQPDGCTALWADEVAAYGLECETAATWGRPDIPGADLCSSYAEEAAFRQRVYWIFRDGPAKSEKNCAAIWAGLAGHPHPEAFNGYPYGASGAP